MTLFDELVARADGTATVLRPLTATMFEPPSFVSPDDEDGRTADVVVGPIRTVAESQPTEPTVVEPTTPSWPDAATPSPTSAAAPTIATITSTDTDPLPVPRSRTAPPSLGEHGAGRHQVEPDRNDAEGSLATEAAEAIAPASEQPDATLGPPDRPAGSTPSTGSLGGPPAAPVAPVATADDGTEVHVSIGRVEVVTRRPPAAATVSNPSAPPRSVPRVDLGEYLGRTTARTRR